MRFEVDTSMHWTDHYVEHGFCVIKQAVPRAFCDEVLAALQQALQTDLPPSGWNTETIDKDLLDKARDPDKQPPHLKAVFESVYEQPDYRALIDTMFGEHNGWGGKPHAHVYGQVWPNGIDPDQPGLSPWLRSHAHNGKFDLPYDDREMTVGSKRARADRVSGKTPK